MNAGIDYGMGKINIDMETGIRYGVIGFNRVCQAWCDASEAEYPPNECPRCGTEVNEFADYEEDEDIPSHGKRNRPIEDDYYCPNCKIGFSDFDFDGAEPISHNLDDEEYQAAQSQDSPYIMIFKSLFYTKSRYCSPCFPGAGDLDSPDEDGVPTYCFGPDWFDGPCPYPVWEVKTDKLVYTPQKD